MILNLNVGIMGHVDSGKTSLAKVISQIASTASFDRNPQSQERGITLDLGFSSYKCNWPSHLPSTEQYTEIQFTFVDSPGHAKLIKTVIGCAQIIDMMILVVDITKGIQTQTAECLAICEVTCSFSSLIVVLNKIDLLDAKSKNGIIDKMTKSIGKKLANFFFGSNVSFVPMSAVKHENVEQFFNVLVMRAFIPKRQVDRPFLMAVDHCFSKAGQGVICTGTILQGQVKINDTIEIASVKQCKNVKSMQMFRQPIQIAGHGDRIGMLITQFDSSQLERGYIAKPGYVKQISAGIIKFNCIKYYTQAIRTNSKFHIIMGYETVMAKITLFTANITPDTWHSKPFNWTIEYQFQEELATDETKSLSAYALLEFEKPINIFPGSIIIGSNMEMDVKLNKCRLAFWGSVCEEATTNDKNYSETFLKKLRIYKEKSKSGNVQRIVNKNEIIVDNLFRKQGNRDAFMGCYVSLSTGEQGIIDSTFGATSKIRVRILDAGLSENTMAILDKSKGDVKVVLNFKKYIYGQNKDKICQ